MRILLTSNYFAPEHAGGIESVTGTLAAGYRSLGHDVRLAAADVRDAPHRPRPGDRLLASSNLAERRLGFPYPLPRWRDLRALRADVEWADAVHVNDCLYAVSQAAYRHAREIGRPVLLTQHVPPIRYPNPLLRGVQALAYRGLGHRLLEGADLVAFVSRATAAAYAQLRFRRLPVVVENAIDTAIFRPGDGADRAAARGRFEIDRDRPVLLFVGRFVAKKGLPALREAARALPAAQVLMAGRPGDVDPRAWGEPNVRVLEPLPPTELRQLYLAADLLFLVSEGEGFPVAVQEAMACGVPALVAPATAAALPGLDELVYVAEGDPAAAARAALATAGARRAAVAETAHRRWAPRVMAQRYDQLLRGLAGPRT